VSFPPPAYARCGGVYRRATSRCDQPGRPVDAFAGVPFSTTPFYSLRVYCAFSWPGSPEPIAAAARGILAGGPPCGPFYPCVLAPSRTSVFPDGCFSPSKHQAESPAARVRPPGLFPLLIAFLSLCVPVSSAAQRRRSWRRCKAATSCFLRNRGSECAG